MSMPLVNATNAVRSPQPVTDGGPSLFPDRASLKGPSRGKRAPDAPVPGALAEFLDRYCMEIRMYADLEPQAHMTILQDAALCDAVYRRSCNALRNAATEGQDGQRLFAAALDVLERVSALRYHAKVMRNTLRQG
ncbi:hypothetical protein [Bordetella flabilis]|uniref:Uncharacterized protein n=1 Tax=Bordetella flabilis TaxID=463014 RepID=A0A193GBC5_9BORD|nr:hypothetical protein [Bordetella flabilis]ANN76761.1 hypothetical protein BAU07_06225 [Bordetella flabilis]